jgi:uncharacterized OB-fold protein
VSGVAISRCAECAWQGTPRRLWCPACGGDRIDQVAVSAGAVAEATTVRRFAGGELAPVQVASITADGGGTLVARLGGGEPGVRVDLSDDRGAPVAMPEEGDVP